MTALVINVTVLVLALTGLVVAARKTVDGLVGVAQVYQVPDSLIAMSIIAVGTSLPEIGSHIMASVGILSGQLDWQVMSSTVIGGNMGSSTVQQILFVGILFLGIGSRQYRKRFYFDTYLPMLGGFLLLFGLAYDGVINRVDGIVLVLIFLGFMVVSYQYREATVDVSDTGTHRLLMDVLTSVIGFAVVVASASISLWYIELIVEQIGLNGSLVGMLSIGFAAALPEFTTVLESIRRDSPYLALGTLVGSNVVNPLMGIGVGAIISTYAVPPSLLWWDLPYKFLVGFGLLIWMYFFRNQRGGRREGFVLVACYFVYLSVRMLVFA